MFYYADPDLFPPVSNPAVVLARAGYAVDIVTYYRGKDWVVDYGPGVRVLRLNGPGMTFPRTLPGKLKGLHDFARRAVRIASREKYDIVYAHDMHGFFAAHRAAKELKRPLVYHCHESPQPGEVGRIDRWIKRYERRHSRDAALIALPEARRALTMIEQSALETEPVIVWNCPLLSPELKTMRLKEELGARAGDDARFIIRHGRLGPGHCIETTIRSMLWWPRRVHFVLMGYMDADYARRQRKLARELGVGERVHVLPPVRYEAVAPYIAGGHLGHSLYEPKTLNFTFASTASLKFFDYLRASLPVIAPNEPGFRALIEEFDCGVCVDHDDPQAIGRAVGELLDDEPRHRKLAANAYRAHAGKCHYEAQYEPVLEFMARFSRCTRVPALRCAPKTGPHPERRTTTGPATVR